MDVNVNVPRSTVTVTLDLTIGELFTLITELDSTSYGLADDLAVALKAAVE